MSDDATRAAQRTAACIAFRHIDEIGEHEREQVLIALIELLPEAEAALANEMLFHMREQKRAQMELFTRLEAQRQPSALKN